MGVVIGATVTHLPHQRRFHMPSYANRFVEGSATWRSEPSVYLTRITYNASDTYDCRKSRLTYVCRRL